jgi:hypothetical protein
VCTFASGKEKWTRLKTKLAKNRMKEIAFFRHGHQPF